MELSKAQKRKLIVFAIVFLMTINITFATALIPIQKAKLQTYIDTNFKTIINYKNIDILNYKISNNIIIIYLKIDGKNVRWLTSLKNYNAIMK